MQPLAQRVLGQQGFDLPDQLVMPPGGKVVLDRELRGGEAQLLVAADQRRRRGGVELARERVRGDVDVQRRVLAQDRLVQVT